MDLSQAKIAVTGATGFLGGYVVKKLLRRGAHVIAVVRNPEKAAEMSRGGVEIRRADLADRPALTEAFRGCDAVIANAAVIALWNPDQTMRSNLEGARNVFHAMADAGVKRALAVSSTSAYPSGLGLRDETTDLRTEKKFLHILNAYGQSKALAERTAWEISAQRGVVLTTVRPCGITASDDQILARYLDRLLRFRIVPLPIGTVIGLSHPADVAEALCLALEQSEVSAGKAYNLQGCTVSLWRLAEAWRKAGGYPRRVRIPVPVPYAVRFDDTKVRRELGWVPRSLEQLCEDAAGAKQRFQ